VIKLRVHLEALDDAGIPRTDLMAMLRGQLTILRMRAERGIPVSVESIARAEDIARTLELFEIAA
jgi:hypothetical protein